MALAVSDARSNRNDQIAHAAAVLGKSAPRRKVFEAVYHGKKKIKTVGEIAKKSKLDRKVVLMEAKKLADQDIIAPTKKDGELAYEKDDFYHANKAKVLRLAKDPKKLAKFPTKYNQGGSGKATATIKALKIHRPRATMITVDDIDSFRRVRKFKAKTYTKMPEARFKAGIRRIIVDGGKQSDWGGERNDIHSTRLVFKGKRRQTVFALKGPGIGGKLTPARMGKNGDQIQRLFLSSAEVFLLQYWSQVDEAVYEQMGSFAKLRSVFHGQPVWWGVIDGFDSTRLINAYPAAFTTKK